MSNKKEKILNVILLGDSDVGKTSLMNQYVKKQFYDYTSPTIGINFETKEIVVDERVVTMRVNITFCPLRILLIYFVVLDLGYA